MMDLSPISTFKMDDLQAKAYKVVHLWLSISREVFPNYSHGKGLPKRGDPRKSMLFKFAYKLVRETQGVIPDNEYSLYIRAQLDILRAIRIGDCHPFIGPIILCGDKAWIRWKVWKKKLKSHTESSTLEEVGLSATDENKVIDELVQTKKYLEGKFSGTYQEHHIMMAKHDMERWVALEKVSPFYALLSPWARKYCNFKNVFDEDLFRASVTPTIDKRFQELFNNETSLPCL
jgi:hypothetical protein